MSRMVKLVLMAVAAAALLFSCAPAIGGMGGLPWLFFLPNLFRGQQTVSAPQTTTKPTPAPTQSQRGGFGGSVGRFGTPGS